MAQELEVLRQQTGSRQENISGFPPGPPPLAHNSYCQPSVGPYPPIMHSHQPNHSGHCDPRPSSYPPPPLQNGHTSRIEGPLT